MRRWFVLMLAAMLSLVFVACEKTQEVIDGENTYLLYFLADAESAGGGDAIEAIEVTLPVEEGAELTEVAAAVVEKLIEGTEGGCSPIGKGIAFNSVFVRGRRAYVDMSQRYGELSGVELSLADYCITLSLTQLEGISSVSITAQGKNPYHRDELVLLERDVLLSTMEDVIETVPVQLYFQDERGVLTEEERMLELYEGQTLAESLIDALQEGPQNKDLSQVLPENLNVNAIRVENRICYLSLAYDEALLPAEVDEQAKILQALAGSIYSMETMDEICILVDGQELEKFGEVPVALIRFRPSNKNENW